MSAAAGAAAAAKPSLPTAVIVMGVSGSGKSTIGMGLARALGWDQPEDGEPGMDLVNDLSVLYTLVRKPPAHCPSPARSAPPRQISQDSP